MHPSRLWLLPAVGAVTVYLAWVFLGRTQNSSPRTNANSEQARLLAEFDRVYGGTALRILQFYSPDADLMEGDHTTLCYGVLNARAVRMEPAVDGVGPSLNRCVAVAPQRETQYTLIAEGNDGRRLTESLTIRTHPDPEELPRISSFRIDGKMVDRGRPVYVLSYRVKNAVKVALNPAVFALPSGPMGRVAVAPDQTTTYELIVEGKHGHSTRAKVTAEVP